MNTETEGKITRLLSVAEALGWTLHHRTIDEKGQVVIAVYLPKETPAPTPGGVREEGISIPS